jgi:hypothetical protein
MVMSVLHAGIAPVPDAFTGAIVMVAVVVTVVVALMAVTLPIGRCVVRGISHRQRRSGTPQQNEPKDSPIHGGTPH